MTATITKWTEDLSVNIAEIDDQHKNLFKIIGDLSTAIQQDKNKEDLRKILESLTDYTVNHFTLEEDYFEKYDYPHKDSLCSSDILRFFQAIVSGCCPSNCLNSNSWVSTPHIPKQFFLIYTSFITRIAVSFSRPCIKQTSI